MSKIGKNPIPIPDGVNINIAGNEIEVKGPFGTLIRNFDPLIKVNVVDNFIIATRGGDSSREKALHGLWRSLINNMVIGVNKGFVRKLTMSGTGYRVVSKGRNLEISAGYTHTIKVEPLGNNRLSTEGQTTIVVSGMDKEVVCNQASIIRRIRKPNPYSGAGIKYENEQIQKKAGKSATK